MTYQPREFAKTATELVFPVKTTKNSPAGKHRSLICRATLMQSGEPITHTLGIGELRIDVPIPPKVNTPPPQPKAARNLAAELVSMPNLLPS